MKPKLFSIIKHHKKELPREQLIKDIIAGVLVAFIALPLSIALGIASGVSPEKGLLTAVIAGFLISFFGGSRVQIGGPTGAFVVIVYGIVQKYGMDGLITATFMAGLILILFGIFKMGSLIKFIPYPITTGFTSGIAVVLFSTQIKEFLGLKINIPAEFIPQWQTYFANFSHAHFPTLLLGMVALLIIIVWPKINRTIPGALVALIGTTLLVPYFPGVETIQTKFGVLQATLPIPELPRLNWHIVGALWPVAVTIALLAAIESLLSAVVADGMIGKKHKSNAELMAQGIANIGSALFGGIPATGAIARTAANVNYGGRTPIAGIVHALTLLVIMYVFMPLAAHIPLCALAAILFTVAYRMSHWRSFVDLFHAPKSDILVLLLTFGLTVFVDLVRAIEVGMVISSFLFMKRMADVTGIKDASEEIEDEMADPDDVSKKKILEKVKIYSINGPFFFGAANSLVDGIENIGSWTKVLILRMSNVPAMDATGMHGLYKIYHRCNQNKIKLLFCRVQHQPLQVMKKSGFTEKIDRKNFCKNIDEALSRATEILSEKQ
jgi:SulP family sulfate permease